MVCQNIASNITTFYLDQYLWVILTPWHISLPLEDILRCRYIYTYIYIYKMREREIVNCVYEFAIVHICLRLRVNTLCKHIHLCEQHHVGAIKWKHFPRYWPFVRGIHRSSVNSPHKGQWRGTLMCSLICALNKRLSKQSWAWWLETPTPLLWRHCNG